MKKKKINPCDTCEHINTYDNDKLCKRSNYTPLKDGKLYNESGIEAEKLYLTCSSCEHSKSSKKLYKSRIKTRPKFKELYNKILQTKPEIALGFKNTYRQMGSEIDFSSGWDYKMFKFYISEYKKHNKSKKEKI